MRQKTKSTGQVLDESAELFAKLPAVQEQIGEPFQLTLLPNPLSCSGMLTAMCPEDACAIECRFAKVLFSNLLFCV